MISAMQRYMIWFDPQDTNDLPNEEDFRRLAMIYGFVPLGRSRLPDEDRELWVASYQGSDHYMHVLNTWVLGGRKHLIYRDGKRLSEAETSAWIARRANAHMMSNRIH